MSERSTMQRSRSRFPFANLLGIWFLRRDPHSLGLHVNVNRHWSLWGAAWGLVCTAALGLGVLRLLTPGRPELAPAQQSAAVDAAEQVVDEIEKANTGVSLVGVLPFANDPSAQVTDALRRQIGERGLFVQKSSGTGEIIQDMLRLDRAEVSDLKTALERGRALHVDAVLFGTVDGPVKADGRTQVTIDYKLARVVPDTEVSSAILLRQHVTSEIADNPLRSSSVPVGWRIVGWCGAILVLPIVLMPLLRAIVRRRSNAANLATLTTLIGIAAGASLWAIGGDLRDFLSALLFIAAVLFSALVSLLILNFALQLEA